VTRYLPIGTGSSLRSAFLLFLWAPHRLWCRTALFLSRPVCKLVLNHPLVFLGLWEHCNRKHRRINLVFIVL